jgi:hypothetical protein
MTNPSPKAQVANTFLSLFGEEHEVFVRGERLVAGGLYITEINVDGDIVARASHQSWRKSYMILRNKVEKLYVDGLSLV